MMRIEEFLSDFLAAPLAKRFGLFCECATTDTVSTDRPFFPFFEVHACASTMRTSYHDVEFLFSRFAFVFGRRWGQVERQDQLRFRSYRFNLSYSGAFVSDNSQRSWARQRAASLMGENQRLPARPASSL